MRIISGTARGHRLRVPDEGTRPATDRTREAVFSMLGDHPENAAILDLFSGSGAYGLEALSRGARHAHLVDSSRQAGIALRANCAAPAFAGRTTIYQTEAATAITRLARNGGHAFAFDLVFADPPYSSSSNWQTLQETLPLALLLPLITADGLLVLERSSEAEPPPDDVAGLELLTSRCYGTSRIEIFRHGVETAETR